MTPMISAIRNRASREDGQAAVLIAVLCGVLIVAVAMVSNMGKVTTEKMAMQNAADMAAYSGAATEAGYLNKMRDKNQKIWDIADRTRQLFETSDIPLVPLFHDPSSDGCQCPAKAAAGPLTAPAAEAVRNTAKIGMQTLEVAIRAENLQGYMQGRSAAIEAADQNYSGTGGHTMIFNTPSGGGMIQLQTAHVELTYRGWCAFICPPAPPIPWVPAVRVTHEGEKLDAWLYKKDRGDAMMAVGIVGAHPVSHFMDLSGNGYFTPTSCQFGSFDGSRCSLDTYALAAPYYGKLGTIENGNAPWEREQLWNVPNPFMVDRASTLTQHKIVRGQHYADYKARFVGIYENQAKLAGTGIQAKNTMLPWGPMMAH